MLGLLCFQLGNKSNSKGGEKSVNSLEMKVAMKRNEDTQEKLAEALGLQISGINARINGHIDFRISEVEKIRTRYNLSDEDLLKIFFTTKVS